MLAKKTSKNQLTPPKAVVTNYPDPEYFDVRDEGGRIVLVPVRANQADRVREKLEQLGIQEGDIVAAVEWAREGALMPRSRQRFRSGLRGSGR